VKETFKVVLGLYPPWWRARYGEEVHAISADLIANGKSPWRVSLNLLFGAVRTRVTGANTPREFASWAGRTRASIAVTTLPLLVVLPFLFTVRQRLQVHVPQLRPATLPLGPYGTNGAGRLAADALVLMAITVLPAIGTIVLGYAELTRAVRAGSPTDRPLRRVVRLPGVAAVVVVALWIASILVGPHSYVSHGGAFRPLDGHPAIGHVLSVAALAVLGVGWLFAIAMSIMVAQRGKPLPRGSSCWPMGRRHRLGASLGDSRRRHHFRICAWSTGFTAPSHIQRGDDDVGSLVDSWSDRIGSSGDRFDCGSDGDVPIMARDVASEPVGDRAALS